MKKLLVLFTAFVLLFALAACGGGETSDDPLNRRDDPTSPTSGEGPDTAPTGGAQGITEGGALSFEAILMYAETGNTEYFQPRVLTAAEQAELRADVERQGGKVTFDADGTIRITGEGSSRLTVHPDGGVEGVDDEGKPFGFADSKEWPTSALGSAVPRADFTISMQVEDEEGLMILFEGVTMEQARAYGKQLAAAGFTVEPEEMYLPEQGMYGYRGRNAADLVLEFNYMEAGGSVTCALTVEPYRQPAGPGEGDPYTPPTDYPGIGEEPQIPGGTDVWPSSGPLTRIPRPDFGTGFTLRDDGDTITVSVSGGTAADFAPYMQKLKEAGFTVSPEYDDDEEVKFYEAHDREGYDAYVQWAYGVFAVGVTTIPE